LIFIIFAIEMPLIFSDYAFSLILFHADATYADITPSPPATLRCCFRRFLFRHYFAAFIFIIAQLISMPAGQLSTLLLLPLLIHFHMPCWLRYFHADISTADISAAALIFRDDSHFLRSIIADAAIAGFRHFAYFITLISRCRHY
jgi:hypothetical protein